MTFEHDDTYDSGVTIKVIGVGGGGNNAVNRMITSSIKGVEFVAINTDRQVLRRSDASQQLVIGEKLTNGFGAGANPQIGARAAEESIEEIKAILDGTDMVFITAGMGGGTGTGAAPVVARVAHEMDILTIGIVTKPFGFEGKRRMDQAIAGIAELSQYVDSLVVIPNDRLKQVTDTRITLQNAFEVADGVLARGTKSISDLISVSAFINLDFADVCSVMKNAGHAHMGVGSATGKDKAELAAKAAISSPLLESSITGAHGILINITASPDVGLEDVDVASSLIAAEASPDANVIWGVNFDDELEDEMRITIIATGFENQVNAQKAAAPAAPAAPVAPAAPATPKTETVKREKPKASADEELDRLMKEFGTPKKKKINR
ncbi:MAG: cell division protein FtsZ [Clostridia bacterium]|nr:cell division protein FtsZ [Clostridia bacterium]